jgi:spore coat protein U-like protein
MNRILLPATALALAATCVCAQAQTATGNLTVTITIAEECTVNTDDNGTAANATIAFGSHGVLNENIDAATAATGAGAVRIQCTDDTPFTIGLSAGANPSTAADVNTRRMANGDTTEFVSYQLYKEAARTSVWGNAGADLVSDTATGQVQSYQVFGRVPPQDTPSADTYTDTVTVTVTY